MSSSKKVFLGVCLLVLLLAGLMFVMRPELFAARDQDGAEAPRPSLAVTTTTPQMRSLARRLPVDGAVVPWQEAIIGSESNGLTLDEVLVDVGERVTKGQVLARFSAVNVGSNLSQARAALAEAQAAAEEAQANARRAQQLARTGALSQQQIEQYQSATKSAQARLRSARAALEARRNDFRHAELRAPDNGIISARTATVGSVPGAGTELFRLVRQGRLEWQAEVSVTMLPQVQPGGAARLHLPDGSKLPLSVRRVAPLASASTRTALVYLDVPEHPQVRGGMYLGGELLFGESEGMVVPAEAVVPRDGFNHVYRVGADQRIERVRVQVGRMQDGVVEVQPMGDARLQLADAIVVRGAGLLSDGDLVRVENGGPKAEGQTGVEAAR